MSPHSDTLSWFRVNHSLFFLLNAACLAEKQQIIFFIVFGFTRSGLEPMIHHTRGDHANHYTIDAVRESKKKSNVPVGKIVNIANKECEIILPCNRPPPTTQNKLFSKSCWTFYFMCTECIGYNFTYNYIPTTKRFLRKVNINFP
jgi:hypothetical protein